MPEFRQGVRAYALTVLVLIACLAPAMWPQHPTGQHLVSDESIDVRMARIEEKQLSEAAAIARIEAKQDAQNTMLMSGLGALVLIPLGWLWQRRK